MRTLSMAVLVLAASGCATAKPAGAPADPRVCLPCAMPCTPEESCGPVKVAQAAKPPPPAPAPAPAPPPVAAAPAAAPSFSPAPGTFTGPQQVTISTDTPGAEIHCTTDGSTPTEASPVCAGPIAVEKDTTVRALAVKPGAPPSAVASGSYGIKPPPPPETPRVTVTKEKLELKEKVYFETGKADIKQESYGLLDEVAQALKTHDEVKKISIQGHTDNTGNARSNQKLSEARANAIREYLEKKGIDGSRLEAKGFGQTKPVASNDTPQGRDQNRRVEFLVVQ